MSNQKDIESQHWSQAGFLLVSDSSMMPLVQGFYVPEDATTTPLVHGWYVTEGMANDAKARGERDRPAHLKINLSVVPATISFNWPHDQTDTSHPNLVVNRKNAHDVYIGRPSKWGNPFEIGRDGDRETVIRKYREWVVTQPHLMAALPELRGKVLGCWCAPQACHGDVLASLANT